MWPVRFSVPKESKRRADTINCNECVKSVAKTKCRHKNKCEYESVYGVFLTSSIGTAQNLISAQILQVFPRQVVCWLCGYIQFFSFFSSLFFWQYINITFFFSMFHVKCEIDLALVRLVIQPKLVRLNRMAYK